MSPKEPYYQCGVHDVIDYLENSVFYKYDPDTEDILDFGTEDELNADDVPTEELVRCYQNYVDKCVEWTLNHMRTDDKLGIIFTDGIKQAKWTRNYTSFIAIVRRFLDKHDAKKAFSDIKTELINQRVAKSD